uniref:Uncharacterized protein n=1 Tax=Arundo donax TaxID=35708 RepID=A0A0A8YT48_ARUDO
MQMGLTHMLVSFARLQFPSPPAPPPAIIQGEE